MTIIKEMALSSETATNWGNYCRQVCIDTVLEDWSYQPIGGVGVEVDIDKTIFSRLKYGRGKAKKNTEWVFGGKERINGDKAFVEVVERRDAKT